LATKGSRAKWRHAARPSFIDAIIKSAAVSILTALIFLSELEFSFVSLEPLDQAVSIGFAGVDQGSDEASAGGPALLIKVAPKNLLPGTRYHG
jgi:hypothetical protein